MDPTMQTAAQCPVHGAAPHRLDYHFSLSTDLDVVHVAKIIGVAIAVVFLIIMAAYIIARALNHCLQHGHHQPEGDAESGRVEVALHLDRHISIVKALPVVVYGADGEVSSSSDGDGCPVCLEEYARGDEVRVLLGCGHSFHRECIDQWLLAQKLTCPMCRGAITVEKEAKP